MYTLYAHRGWGSALVELQLEWYGLDYRLEDVGDLFQDEVAVDKLRSVNPLAQIPVLILPDGQIMTESAAITLHLAEVTGRDDLVPSPPRPQFLRWLIYLVANVYPTFSYADVPARFVSGEEAQKAFADNVNARARSLWSVVEAEAKAPWFLGEQMTALDLFIAVMTKWRPRRAWFAANAPRLTSIASAFEAQPKIAKAWERNFEQWM